MKSVITAICVVCMCFSLYAQQRDTVVILQSVVIQADKYRAFNSPIQVVSIDTTILNVRKSVNLAELLSEHTSFLVNRTGPSGVSTISIRGTNSTQSSIFWNGINLYQANIGMTDLSRISLFAFDNIEMQTGGESTLLGTGVIGGSIHLSNTAHFNKPLSVDIQTKVGSYGNYFAATRFTTGGRKIAYSGSLSGDWNENDYKYRDFNNITKKIAHAFTKSVSSVHQLDFRLNNNHSFSSGFWYQKAYREIPPSILMSKSDQIIKDESIRTSMQWRYVSKKQTFLTRMGYTRENESYNSKSLLIDSYYKINQVVSEVEYKRVLGDRFMIGSGVMYQHHIADVYAYSGIKQQVEGSYWVALSYSSLDSIVKLVLKHRQMFSSGYGKPFLPAISSEFRLARPLKILASFSENYKIPTLNDRFWFPGGNINLLPERSWNSDMVLRWNAMNNKKYKLEISSAVYRIFIHEMIQWVPGTSGLWTPQNVSKVKNTGIEMSLKGKMMVNGLTIGCFAGYNYSPSKYAQSYVLNNEIVGNQLINIPIHKYNLSAYVDKNSYFGMLSMRYMGKRYTNSENTDAVNAYFVFDVLVKKELKIKNTSLKLQIELRNILDAQYQLVQYYPEPGRNTNFSLTLNL